MTIRELKNILHTMPPHFLDAEVLICTGNYQDGMPVLTYAEQLSQIRAFDGDPELKIGIFSAEQLRVGMEFYKKYADNPPPPNASTAPPPPASTDSSNRPPSTLPAGVDPQWVMELEAEAGRLQNRVQNKVQSNMQSKKTKPCE